MGNDNHKNALVLGMCVLSTWKICLLKGTGVSCWERTGIWGWFVDDGKFLLLALGISIMFALIIIIFWLPNRDMKCLSFMWLCIAFVTNIYIHEYMHICVRVCICISSVSAYVLMHTILNRKKEVLETCRLCGRLAPGFHSKCHLNAF